MAITYPIAFPTVQGVMDLFMRAERVDAMSMSPFTYAQQVVKHPGQRWTADITLPPMAREIAEQFIAFALQLDGRSGTFTFSPSDGVSTMGAGGGSPTVNGASQTGAELAVSGGPLSTTAWLKAGDYIQLGSGATARLHKVLVDADTDGSGDTTLDIWPSLREAPGNASTVLISNAGGVFRLAQPVQDWSVDSASHYGLTFSIVEAI